MGRDGYNMGRDGYNMGRDGYNMGRDGYNMGRDGYNMGRDGYNMGRDGYNESGEKDSPVPTPQADGSRPGTPTQRTYSPRPDRRPTLSPIPGVRPGISVSRGRTISICSRKARQGIYSPSELSDDSSWDSELDGPDSDDTGLEDSGDESPRFFEHRTHNQRYRYEEDEDEFERDPWNAVCVLGLRVYSKDTDVTIEVVNGDGGKRHGDGDDASVISSGRRKEKELDVDDSAADATSPLRTRGNLDSALAERVRQVDNAPAGHELDRSGTTS
jgi:hypothetical protein